MLTSLKNPSIKQIRKLHRSKERQKQNLLLLEGTNLIESAVKLNYPLKTLCYTDKWQKNYQDLFQQAIKLSQTAELVSPEVIASIATTVNPDGIVATAPRRNNSVNLSDKISLGLALERLQDPGNLGTIMRSAIATGVDALWLSRDSVDLDNPKVLRASAGEWFRVPVATSDNLVEVVTAYQQQGVQIVAASPTATTSYWEINWCCPNLILIGNEGSGLSQGLSQLADQQVSIPLGGGVESLNVAIATSLLLYEAVRQKIHSSLITQT